MSAVIIPNYSVPSMEAAPSWGIQVGQAVRDLPTGAETTAKRAHSVAETSIRLQFEADTIAYEQALPALLEKAQSAKSEIGPTKTKQSFAILALALDIIGAIGVTIAAAATRSPTLTYAAISLWVIAIPAAITNWYFSEKEASLRSDIEAPVRQKPVLTLPVYHSERDLELAETRKAVQNALGGKTSVKKLAHSGFSTDDCISYALLDKVVPLTNDKKTAFYAKCTQLMDACTKIESQKKTYTDQANHAFKERKNELKRWRSDQNRSIGAYIRSSNERMYSKSSEQNRRWLEETTKAIETQYIQAMKELEKQFSQAKVAAVI